MYQQVTDDFAGGLLASGETKDLWPSNVAAATFKVF
jgi:hypothetical protein